MPSVTSVNPDWTGPSNCPLRESSQITVTRLDFFKVPHQMKGSVVLVERLPSFAVIFILSENFQADHITFYEAFCFPLVF